MSHQTTLLREAGVSGMGLHTGIRSSVTFKPAPAGTGVVFVRTDLPGKPHVQALVQNVVDVVRGTTLGWADVRIYTVEHILTALYGLGVDNVFVELDNIEPPVGDGSANAFTGALQKAGLKALDSPRQIFILQEPIEYTDQKTVIKAEPADELSLKCSIFYDHPLIKHQTFATPVTPEAFTRDISPARTFCFDFEVETLKRSGLAKGGSLENAVVIGMSKFYSNEKELRFAEEFARHKMLDLLGDLYLLGGRLQARVTAERCGHGHNIKFVKQLASAWAVNAAHSCHS
jgi:UDP-3-O-acyl N-acetylglucosamine deacetylase